MNLYSMACRGLGLAAALPGVSRGPENVRINMDGGSGPKGNSSNSNSSSSLNMTWFITYLMAERLSVMCSS